MAEAKKKKEVKDYTVLRKSIGSALVFKGERIILNNGLKQSTLKALYALGMKAILKADK